MKTNEAITIQVIDDAGQTSNQTFSLNVSSSTIPLLQSVLSQSAYVLNEGQFYSFTPVSGSGGVTPYVYSTQSILPNGLSFSANTGEIYGTPTEVTGETTILITVTDSVPQISSQSFNVSVVASPASIDSVARNLAQDAYDKANTAFDAANTAAETGGFITIKEDGVYISNNACTINFVGATVTSSNSGNDVTVTVSGGDGGFTLIDLGYVYDPVTTFDLMDFGTLS